jgi:hypothetical protein
LGENDASTVGVTLQDILSRLEAVEQQQAAIKVLLTNDHFSPVGEKWSFVSKSSCNTNEYPALIAQSLDASEFAALL